jgi:hypothetical protein
MMGFPVKSLTPGKHESGLFWQSLQLAEWGSVPVTESGRDGGEGNETGVKSRRSRRGGH